MQQKLDFLFLLNLIILISFFKVEANSKFLLGKRFQKVTHDLDKGTDGALYFDQILDHFNLLLKQKWKQRYWVNEQYFDKQSGPVFIWVEGVGEADDYWISNTTITEIAKQTKALLISLEHRYYGKSRPTSDASVKNLAYLSTEQALADIANFRDYIHNNYKLSDSNKWVFFGGSYSGSLVAWFRLKYPHLAHASVASSAPINAILDFSDYLVVVNRSLNTYSPECPKNIQTGMQQLINLMKTKQGKNTVAKLFKTCQPLNSENDITNFYSSLIGYFQGAVQYNRNSNNPNDLYSIENICNIMNNNNIGDALKRLVEVNNFALKAYGSNCTDASYANFINLLKKTSWNEQVYNGFRQSIYQQCTEVGYYVTTNAKSQPFGNVLPLSFFTNMCKDIFGKMFDLSLSQESVRNLNLNFGAYNFKGSRVVFTNGDVDPWSALSFTKQAPNNQTDIIYIKGTSHCADLYKTKENDLTSLKEARKQLNNIVLRYLSEN